MNNLSNQNKTDLVRVLCSNTMKPAVKLKSSKERSKTT